MAQENPRILLTYQHILWSWYVINRWSNTLTTSTLKHHDLLASLLGGGLRLNLFINILSCSFLFLHRCWTLNTSCTPYYIHTSILYFISWSCRTITLVGLEVLIVVVLLGCNTVYPVENESTFRRNVLSPFSWPKNKPSKKLVSCSAYSLTLKREAICFFKTSVDFQQITWHYSGVRKFGFSSGEISEK